MSILVRLAAFAAVGAIGFYAGKRAQAAKEVTLQSLLEDAKRAGIELDIAIADLNSTTTQVREQNGSLADEAAAAVVVSNDISKTGERY